MLFNMKKSYPIYCCGCEKIVHAYLTNGMEIYPHRQDLANIPFWKCDICKNFVGCHYKTNNITKPLGCIPTLEIKKYRVKIHDIIDPLWKGAENKKQARIDIYNKISNFCGYSFHTAELKNITEAEKIYTFCLNEF
jgi:hypothetical protein